MDMEHGYVHKFMEEHNLQSLSDKQRYASFKEPRINTCTNTSKHWPEICLPSSNRIHSTPLNKLFSFLNFVAFTRHGSNLAFLRVALLHINVFPPCLLSRQIKSKCPDWLSSQLGLNSIYWFPSWMEMHKCVRVWVCGLSLHSWEPCHLGQKLGVPHLISNSPALCIPISHQRYATLNFLARKWSSATSSQFTLVGNSYNQVERCELEEFEDEATSTTTTTVRSLGSLLSRGCSTSLG